LSSKDIVAGLGEIGKPILQLLSRAEPAVGYDGNEKLLKKYGVKTYHTRTS